MKTKLETYVKENRKAFDALEPSAGLWDKITSELDKKQPKKPVRLYAWISAAASVVIIAGLTWMYSARTEQQIDIADINPAYAKKEIHMVNLIEEKRDSLAIFAKSDPGLYNEFNTDLNSLDKEYEKLKNNLQASPDQLSIVKAMVRNREIQLQILNQQLHVVNQINQYKIEKENSL